MRGTVKFYNEKRGFGFITREGGDDVFFHVTDVEEKRYLEQNDKVEFEVVEGREGKKKAVKVKRMVE